MEKTALNMDIRQEQLKAQEEIKKQGYVFLYVPEPAASLTVL